MANKCMLIALSCLLSSCQPPGHVVLTKYDGVVGKVHVEHRNKVICIYSVNVYAVDKNGLSQENGNIWNYSSNICKNYIDLFKEKNSLPNGQPYSILKGRMVLYAETEITAYRSEIFELR